TVELEMQRVRLERVARRLFRRPIEHARAKKIDDDREHDHGEGPGRCLHLRRLYAPEPFGCLPSHYAGENEQQRGLGERGNTLDLAVAVMMFGVCGLA